MQDFYNSTFMIRRNEQKVKERSEKMLTVAVLALNIVLFAGIFVLLALAIDAQTALYPYAK